ncbi:Protein of unknown function [Pyronema omphalodes CBS 100304]|uniref:Uncharacterized protein n=1 Tax=Pyronema omphalodes (strain CBS 100304) TaxID=1076935 RepID=U4KZR3_PYROM|nr:Protein of unknown function [Pyronema omphalodes CBS 100304]
MISPFKKVKISKYYTHLHIFSFSARQYQASVRHLN